jgi:hypothetical protein
MEYLHNVFEKYGSSTEVHISRLLNLLRHAPRNVDGQTSDVSGSAKAWTENMAYGNEVSSKRQNKTQNKHLAGHTWLYNGYFWKHSNTAHWNTRIISDTNFITVEVEEINLSARLI